MATRCPTCGSLNYHRVTCPKRTKKTEAEAATDWARSGRNNVEAHTPLPGAPYDFSEMAPGPS